MDSDECAQDFSSGRHLKRGEAALTPYVTGSNSQPAQSKGEINEVLHFNISTDPPVGLAGNFDGWKKSSVFSQSSEISQWHTTYQRVNSLENYHDEGRGGGRLYTLELHGCQCLIRQLESGSFVPYGQLSIDRSPSQEVMIRKRSWATAVSNRVLTANLRDKSDNDARVHNCNFCSSNCQNWEMPNWLYDRAERRTVTTTEEFNSEVRQYEVLSYTWGRAASNNWEDVPGVPWRVRSSIGLPISRILEMLESFDERYVWIDMFCIPQECPVAKAREVARQAQIFGAAKGGIVWLHQTSEVWPRVFGIASWAICLNKEFNRRQVSTVSPLAGTFMAIEELTEDPWFSSTWALQEAILRPNMRMIGIKERNSALLLPYGTLEQACFNDGAITLEEFRAYINVVRAVASDTLQTSLRRPLVRAQETSLMTPEDALQLERLLQDTGLLGLVTPTPAAILSGLSVRTSVKPHDQYYGIQSVFNLSMPGDYSRSLESVRGEFLAHIWTRFAPILALALNRPILNSGSAHFMHDTEDSLLRFSYAHLQGGGIFSCAPNHFSKVSAHFDSKNNLCLASVESSFDDDDGKLWHYEARGSPPSYSKVIAFRYGLPPLPVSIKQSGAHMFRPPIQHSWYKMHILDSLKTWWHQRNDRDGKAFFMDRTTRLLYLGQLVNEQGLLGMRRNPHIYMEYYLKKSGIGHRVGAIASDLPFRHEKVNGAVAID